MAITRWDPFRDVLALQNRMHSLLQEYGRGNDDADTLSSDSLVLPVDIYEDANHIVLTLEAPGMKQDGFDIQVENNTLSVRGERRFESEDKQDNYHRVERRYGSFYRAFTLPPTVNAESVQASYDAGVLRVEIEKRAEAKPRQIKVAVGSGAKQPQIEGNKTQAEAGDKKSAA